MRRQYLIVISLLIIGGCGPNRLMAPLSEEESQKMAIYQDLDSLHQLQISNSNEPGKPLQLALTFVWKDTHKPLKRHFVSFYHTDSAGNYQPKNPNDESTARLGGQALTNEKGQILVSTILPGDYGSSDDNRHIHTSVYGAKPVGYDIHFKQYTGMMGKSFIEGSDQHFLADLRIDNDKLMAFLTIEVKSNARSNDVIAFNSARNGNGDIFLMDDEGHLFQQVTSSSEDQWSPSWVNSNELAFLEQTAVGIIRKKVNIYSLDSEILPHPVQCILDDKNMRYIPNGKGGYFVCLPDIYSISDSKNDTINLTASLSGTSNYPELSPDGQTILFTNNQTGDNDVYSLNLVSGVVKNLTNNPANDERGVLSPDGSLLAFSTNRFERSAQDIVIQNLINGEILKITNSDGYALIAKWSSDGNTLFYGSNSKGDWEIFRYDLKSKLSVNISQSEGFDGDPQVRPK